MKNMFWLAIVSFAITQASAKGASNEANLSADGWQVSADRAELRVSHDRLGPVLNRIRLNVRSGNAVHPLSVSSVSKTGDKTLAVQTTGIRTGWSFRIDGNTLQISCTDTAALVTAEAPAPADRFPARILDEAGAPVTWSGTGEVANGYDGTYTRHPSALPQRNPDVMYFSLGQISAAGLHSLFDRKTDIAITFARDVSLERDRQNKNVLAATIPVRGSTSIRLTPDYFTETLGVPYYAPYDDSVFPKAPMVWSSWTGYYAEVTENDIVRNADWLSEHLKPYGFQYVQLDDGYDRGKAGEHDWIENWDRAKFPHSPEWLTQYIKSKGLKAGIWLVPNAYAGAVTTHPDWYVRDKQGKVILDYNTPTLDSTNPEALAQVKKIMQTLDRWGFEYYKFDGEHAFSKYVPAVDRSKLFDPAIDPLVTYRKRLELIRQVVGPRTFIEGCPAGTPLNGIQYFNSYFNGDDVYNSWQGMYPLFSSINANAFLNHLVVYVMPGEGIDVAPAMSAEEARAKRNPTFLHVAGTREKPLAGFGATLPEARTLVSYLALTGVVYPLASILPELPDERVRLLKQTLPTLPIFPVDLFSRGTDMTWDKFRHVQPDFYIHNYPEILDLKVNVDSGVYDLVGLTNWRSAPLHRQLSLSDQIGLSTGSSYVVFDFWKQQSLGTFKDTIDLDVEPHDTRVLAIHPLLDRPQLIGLSRHISGAYSVKDLSWEPSSRILRGSAATIPGERYDLFFSTPARASLSSVRVTSQNGQSLPAEHKQTGDSLTISFKPLEVAAKWEVRFGS